jgi:AraC-like DNA-binding protein
VGYRVGYEDASHFTREYKRLFGIPPSRDVVLVGQNPTKTTGGFVDFDDSRISDKIGAQAKDRKLEPHEGLGR